MTGTEPSLFLRYAFSSVCEEIARLFRDKTLISSNAENGSERASESERGGKDDWRHVPTYRLSSSRISWIPGWNESTNRLELLEEP